ncbi:MAG: hypothetical protein NT133_11795 [Alphaproteobacteria bacterium]|nr:hypothetical protein [Alphaproteobacteria bacterium]
MVEEVGVVEVAAEEVGVVEATVRQAPPAPAVARVAEWAAGEGGAAPRQVARA